MPLQHQVFSCLVISSTLMLRMSTGSDPKAQYPGASQSADLPIASMLQGLARPSPSPPPLPRRQTATAAHTATTVTTPIVSSSQLPWLPTAATAHMTQPTCSGALMTCTHRTASRGPMRLTWTTGVTCSMTQVSSQDMLLHQTKFK